MGMLMVTIFRYVLTCNSNEISKLFQVGPARIALNLESALSLRL